MNPQIKASGDYVMKLCRRGGETITKVCRRMMGRWFTVETYDGRVVFDRGRWGGMTFAWDAKRRARLNPIGAVMKARLGGYMRLREAFLRDRQCCERCGKQCKRDVHHTRGRAGDLLTAVQWWVALCRDCHDWVAVNPNLAMSEVVAGIPLLGRAWNHAASGGRTDVSKNGLLEDTKRRIRGRVKVFNCGRNAGNES